MKVLQFLELGFNFVEKKIIEDKIITGVSIDTRSIEAGNIFFAIKGEKANGNDFIDVAVSKNSALIFTDERAVFDSCSDNIVLVEDVLKSIYEIGKIRFNKFDKPKIVITGSFGKTTTKELLRDILSTRFKIYSTKGNYNNKLGVSLTGAGLDDEADFAIIEIGTSAKGEIAELAEIIQPSIAIVTTIGHAHIGYFGSFEAIIEEKLSVTKSLKDGTLFLPSEFKKYVKRSGDIYKLITFGKDGEADVRLIDMKTLSNGIEFSLQNFNSKFFINYYYEHIVFNCLPLIYLATVLGMSNEQIAQGLRSSKPFHSRGGLLKVKGLEILDDCYNAGLESMINAIQSLSKFTDKKRTAIIGEIAEIDGFEDEIFGKIYETAKGMKEVNFILIGQSYMKYDECENIKIFKDKPSAFETVSAVKEGVVLVKASHSKGFDEVVNLLKGS